MYICIKIGNEIYFLIHKKYQLFLNHSEHCVEK